MSLSFAYVEYSMSTRSIDIFSNGCYGKCKGCCNPEIKDWNLSGLSLDEVINKVKHLTEKFNRAVDRFILVGGDPVDAYIKYPEYLKLVKVLKELKPIFLFTRHDIEEIPKELIKEVDYIKTGAYIPELSCDDNIQYGIKLATSNQKILKVEDILNGYENN